MNYEMPPSHVNDLPVVLNKDQQAVAIKACTEIIGGLDFLRQCLKDNKLKVSTRYNVLSVIEDHLEKLGKTTGQDISLHEDLEIYRKQVREANQEIRDLHKQLANATPLDGLGDFLHALGKQFDDYWTSLGFTLAEGNFQARWSGDDGRYCVKLSCFINPYRHYDSDTPITDKENSEAKIEEMKKELDIFGKESDCHLSKDRDCYLLDTPKNKTWIINKIREKFPSFCVNEWESRPFYHKNPDLFYIAHIEGRVNLNDFKLDNNK